MTVYLDCNATTPMEPEVLEIVIRYMRDEYGNSGSRTHEFGLSAKKAVERARDAVAAVVEADPQEVIFTSGATESNNLALLGLADAGRRTGRMHLISTAIEHKAVLEPLEQLGRSRVRSDADSVIELRARRPRRRCCSAASGHAAGQRDARQQRDRRDPATGRDCGRAGQQRGVLSRGRRSGIRQGARGSAQSPNRPDQRERSQDLWPERRRCTDRPTSQQLASPADATRSSAEARNEASDQEPPRCLSSPGWARRHESRCATTQRVAPDAWRFNRSFGKP